MQVPFKKEIDKYPLKQLIITLQKPLFIPPFQENLYILQ